MQTTTQPRPRYRYELVVDGKVVFHNFTTDLDLAQQNHLRRYPRGEVRQVGDPTTHREAFLWNKEYWRTRRRPD